MMTHKLQQIINRAFSWATERDQAYVTLEHLAYFLLEDEEVQQVFYQLSVHIAQLKQELENYLLSEIETLPEVTAHPTLSFQKVIETAIYKAQTNAQSEVKPLDLMAVLLQEGHSHFAYFLAKQNIEAIDVLTYIIHGPQSQEDEDWGFEEEMEVDRQPLKEEESEFLISLNIRALAGEIDPVIGRENELRRMMEVLVRRKKNNPVLVGDPGVGKTALAEALALDIIEEKVPQPLADAEVFMLDLSALIAGTRYRGDFEKRLKAIIKEVKDHPHAIVFIDEIHTILGAGAAQGGSMDVANLLKPALAQGEFKCIGATTFEEYRQVFTKDKALARRFQKIDVLEPSREDTLKILQGLKKKLEDHHQVHYSQEALEAAVDLSIRHIHERFLPDKAIDVLDEAGAYVRLESRRNRRVNEKIIRRIVARSAQIPLEDLQEKEQKQLKNLAQRIKAQVYGQDDAIDTIAQQIIRAKAGLGNGEQPLGAFLLTGPTGVGKTEVAKQLAQVMNVPLIRFDMSEYREPHSVARLIGAPPGYVGYESGGLLTEQVHKSPYAVVLLDEIEKAHPDIFNLLLQVMDNGQLTDNNGRVTNFRHVILLMTANIGAEVYDKNPLGFVAQREQGDQEAALKNFFSPEFRNRLSAVVNFKPLSPVHMHQVVTKEIKALKANLAAKGYSFSITPRLAKFLATAGYDAKLGARPLKRLIEQKLNQPLAEMLLFDTPESGASIRADCLGKDCHKVQLKVKVNA